MSWAGVWTLESSSESPHLERDVRDLDRPRRPVVSSTASCVVVEQLLHQVDVSSTYRKTLQPSETSNLIGRTDRRQITPDSRQADVCTRPAGREA